MAKKTITVSDLSGRDIPDGEIVSVVVESYPGLSEAVRIDAGEQEINQLKLSAKEYVMLQLVMPDGSRESLALDADVFSKGFRGDADEVLSTAERAYFPPAQEEQPRRRGRRPRGEGGAPASAGPKVNYTDEDKFGQVHRGRITDEEIELVINNPAQASQNREAQGNGPINWDDPKEQQRYHLDEALIADIKKRLAG